MGVHSAIRHAGNFLLRFPNRVPYQAGGGFSFFFVALLWHGAVVLLSGCVDVRHKFAPRISLFGEEGYISRSDVTIGSNSSLYNRPSVLCSAGCYHVPDQWTLAYATLAATNILYRMQSCITYVGFVDHILGGGVLSRYESVFVRSITSDLLAYSTVLESSGFPAMDKSPVLCRWWISRCDDIQCVVLAKAH